MSDFMMLCGTPLLAISILVGLFLGLTAIFDPNGFSSLMKEHKDRIFKDDEQEKYAKRKIEHYKKYHRKS